MPAADEEGERLIWLWLIFAKLLVMQLREENMPKYIDTHTQTPSMCMHTNKKREDTQLLIELTLN